ncbi:LytR C-terminal domain-containing protein [Gordonia sp. FQ]|uniref:LytR C-terminal domain-containing protein n=1 Tax=Gordonia sp. FQ TaxID=3446634 RepID=UPI003F8648CA
MKADRETNRLPLRAGAMLLLAVAVVFIALGWHSAASSGKESGKDKLEQAGQSVASTEQASGTTTAPASTKPSDTTSTQAADVPKLCVLNAGTETGLAKKVSDDLKSKGFAIGTDPSNLSTSSVTENTIFYGEGEEAAAKKVAEAVPNGADVTVRPDNFTKCPGELVVVVVN